MGQREHRRPCPDPPFSLSFSVSPFYIPHFTCLCFLSSMLWQWCSMLMRQCVVQPQAVIFQVISRVLNTRLLLFYLMSSRSGFPLHGRDPGHAPLPQAAPGWQQHHRTSGGAKPETPSAPSPSGWRGSLGGSWWVCEVRGCSTSAASPGFFSPLGQGVWKDGLCLGGGQRRHRCFFRGAVIPQPLHRDEGLQAAPAGRVRGGGSSAPHPQLSSPSGIEGASADPFLHAVGQ